MSPAVECIDALAMGPIWTPESHTTSLSAYGLHSRSQAPVPKEASGLKTTLENIAGGMGQVLTYNFVIIIGFFVWFVSAVGMSCWAVGPWGCRAVDVFRRLRNCRAAEPYVFRVTHYFMSVWLCRCFHGPRVCVAQAAHVGRLLPQLWPWWHSFPRVFSPPHP